MKHKILLTGKASNFINEFFMHMDSSFECLSSSTRYPDLTGHVKYFKPDAVVFCMNGETRENINAVVSLREQILKPEIPLVVLSDDDDYDFFMKQVGAEADATLKKPITVQTIQERLTKILEKKRGSEKNTEQDNSYSPSAISLPSLDDIDSALENVSSGNAVNLPTRTTASLGKKSEKDPSDRQRIMIIDDSSLMLKTIKVHLEGEYDVATAINGKIALKYLQHKSVDLILLDYEMPEEDGPVVFEKLKTNPLTEDIPVVFLTGINDASKIQKALSLKPKGYLLKPVDKNTLLNKVHEILD